VNGLRKFAVYAFVASLTLSFIAVSAEAKGPKDNRAKNIIFMVPDGMGLADVTAARIFKYGPDGDRLSFELLPVIGYQSTHSANSTVTDSAAAASAWASGDKYNNGEISCHDNNSDGDCDDVPVQTILDVAQKKGKAAGLVTTSDITHATPAAFGSNVHNRKCEEEIALQYLARDIEVLLGGGIEANRSPCKLRPSVSQENWLDVVLGQYEDADYTIVYTEDDMNAAVDAKAKKLLGLFKKGGKTQEIFRVDSTEHYPDGEPTLPEMTKAALGILEKNKKGFFLLVECAQIDWANHDQKIKDQLAETLALDETVEVVLDWVYAKKKRLKETLIVVVPDHETAGFAITGPNDTLTGQGQPIEDAWASSGHTAVDVLIWAQGPNSSKFGQALDNTDLYYLMKEAMK
jgi:alkaline phosphatase